MCKSYPKIPKYRHQTPKIAFVYRSPVTREPGGNRVPVCLLFLLSLGTFGNFLLLAWEPHFFTTLNSFLKLIFTWLDSKGENWPSTHLKWSYGTCLLTHWLTEPLTLGLFDYHWLADSLTRWLTDSRTLWPSDPLPLWHSDPLTLWLSDPLTLWLSGCLTVWYLVGAIDLLVLFLNEA